MIVLYCIDDLRQFCCENQDLTSVTHMAPGWPLTLNKEGLKLMHMYDLYGNAM